VKAVQQSIKPEKASKPTASAASPKKAFSWILLVDALALITNAYQNSGLAQRKLCKAFVESQVRTRAACAEGGWIKEQGQEQWKEYEHNLRLSDLWRREYFAPDSTPYSKLQIHWQDSSAMLETDALPVTVTFYRIEVAREDLLKLLPNGYELPQQQPAPAPQRKRGGGRRERYEWDRVFAQFLRLIEEDGWPQIQSYREFAEKVCDACAEAGMEPTPSVDTVREKISIWLSARRR
jgi:hypothetical protein